MTLQHRPTIVPGSSDALLVWRLEDISTYHMHHPRVLERENQFFDFCRDRKNFQISDAIFTSFARITRGAQPRVWRVSWTILCLSADELSPLSQPSRSSIPATLLSRQQLPAIGASDETRPDLQGLGSSIVFFTVPATPSPARKKQWSTSSRNPYPTARLSPFVRSFVCSGGVVCN